MARPSGTKGDKRAATGWFLALFGAVPFVVMAIALHVAPEFSRLHLGGLHTLELYAAIILSFMAGIRWGTGLFSDNDSEAAGTLVASTINALVAWLAVLTASPYTVMLLVAGFLAQGVWDWRSAARGVLPGWYGPLRLVLTVIVTLSLLVAAMA